MMTTFESLLIVHGVVIRVAFLAGAIIAGPLLLRWLVRRSRRRDARRRRDSLGAPLREVDDGLRGSVVTLAGRLEAAGPCPSFERGQQVAASTAASRRDAVEACSIRPAYLGLRTDGGWVTLEGPLEVMAGSTETWSSVSFRWLSKSIRERIGAAGELPHRDTVIMRSLVAGDAVRVRGVLAAGVDEGELGYRVGSVAWRLLPVTHRGEAGYEGIPWLEAAAERPRRSTGFGVTWRARVAVAMVLLSLLAPTLLYGLTFVLGGPLALSTEGDDGWVSPLVLATATTSRDRALSRLQGRLEHQERLDDRDIARVVALSRVSTFLDLRSIVERQVQRGDLETAERLARALGSPLLREVVADHWAEVGRFDRASALLRGVYVDARQGSAARAVITDVLAGRQAVVRALNQRCGYQVSDCSPTWEERREQRFDSGFVDELRMANSEGRDICPLIVAEQQHGQARLRSLDECPTCATSDDTAALTALLRYEALLEQGCSASDATTGSSDCADAAQLAADALSHLSADGLEALLRPVAPAVPPGLEAAVLERLDGRDDLDEPTRALRAELEAGVAAFALLVDDREEARSYASAAIVDLSALDPEIRGDRIDYAVALETAIEVRDGQLDAAEASLDTLSRFPEGDALVQALEPWIADAREPALSPLSARAGFDLMAKTRHVSQASERQGRPDDLPSRPQGAYAAHPSELVLRHLSAAADVEQGRAQGVELAAASDQDRGPAFPYDLLLRSSRELAGAEAMGDEVAAERARQALARFRSALLDRETAVLAHVVSIGQRGQQEGRRLTRVDTP